MADFPPKMRLILGLFMMLDLQGSLLPWRVACWVVGEAAAERAMCGLGWVFGAVGKLVCRLRDTKWEQRLALWVFWGLKMAELALCEALLALIKLALVMSEQALAMAE